jgi:hypothetical protein
MEIRELGYESELACRSRSEPWSGHTTVTSEHTRWVQCTSPEARTVPIERKMKPGH